MAVGGLRPASCSERRGVHEGIRARRPGQAVTVRSKERDWVFQGPVTVRSWGTVTVSSAEASLDCSRQADRVTSARARAKAYEHGVPGKR